MKGLQRLVLAHTETSCSIAMKFNYHRHQKINRIYSGRTPLGNGPWKYEFVLDFYLEGCFRKSAGRSYKVLKRLCKLNGIYL
jgi:hypothetical protein